MNPEQVLSRGHYWFCPREPRDLGQVIARWALSIGQKSDVQSSMAAVPGGLSSRGWCITGGKSEQMGQGQECARKNRMLVTNRTTPLLASLVTWTRRRGPGRDGPGRGAYPRPGLSAFPCLFTSEVLCPQSSPSPASEPPPSPPPNPPHLPQNKGTKGRHSVNLKLLLFLPVSYTRGGGGGVGEKGRGTGEGGLPPPLRH